MSGGGTTSMDARHGQQRCAKEAGASPVRFSFDIADGCLRLNGMHFQTGQAESPSVRALEERVLGRPLMSIDVELLQSDARLTDDPVVINALTTLRQLQDVLRHRVHGSGSSGRFRATTDGAAAS